MGEKEVTTKAMRALKEVLKKGFQECFPKLCECWQTVGSEGNYFKGNAV
jgi:hypothetical protein